MSYWKTHIPAGVQDFLPDEYYNKLLMENKAREIFDKWGYLEVEPPSFEYFDVFSEGKPSIEQEQMFKFFEPGNRILVLRPDFTMPIARMVATKLRDERLPIRLSYVDNVYRYEELQSGKQREIAQAGIELMGIKGVEADAEVIAIAIESIKNMGLSNFQIDIGQVEFYKGLIEECGIKGEEADRLTSLIDNKNMLALELFLNKLNVSDNTKTFLKKLPLLYGDSSMLDEAYSIANNSKSKKAVDNLYTVYEILKDYGLSKYITFDFGMVHSINYYTGIIFKGMTSDIGYPICGGGRYDGLVSEFGYDIPATGFALGIKRILIALERQKGLFERPNIDVLVVFDEEDRKQGYEYMGKLRKEGKRVEHFLLDRDKVDIKEYAISKSIDKIVDIKKGKIEEMIL